MSLFISYKCFRTSTERCSAHMNDQGQGQLDSCKETETAVPSASSHVCSFHTLSCRGRTHPFNGVFRYTLILVSWLYWSVKPCSRLNCVLPPHWMHSLYFGAAVFVETESPSTDFTFCEVCLSLDIISCCSVVKPQSEQFQSGVLLLWWRNRKCAGGGRGGGLQENTTAQQKQQRNHFSVKSSLNLIK